LIALEVRSEYSKLILTVDYDFPAEMKASENENSSRVIYECIGVEKLNYHQEKLNPSVCSLKSIKKDKNIKITLQITSKNLILLSFECLEISIKSWQSYDKIAL
jgi:hypothetical protein